MDNEEKTYARITVRMMLDLAAPHTWAAAVMPAMIGICIAAQDTPISIPSALACLVAVILMQSSVNTLNDYADFVKGTDAADADVDPDDAVLVYNRIRPRSVLILGIVFLVIALALGIAIIVASGIAPLIVALIGALCVLLYSGGRTPISYLPLGELISGVVMGGLIPLGMNLAFGRMFVLDVVPLSIPCIISVGLIMFTNNSSDIERDRVSNRRTLAVVLGREKCVFWYKAAVIVWLIAIVLCIAIRFRAGLILVPFMLVALIPTLKGIFQSGLRPDERRQSMQRILSLNLIGTSFYAAMMLASANIAF